MRQIVLLVLGAGLAATPQTLAPARTGLIVGQVIKAGSNRPVPEALAESWGDPKILEGLVRAATRVSLAESEKRSLDLKVAAGR